MSETTFPAPLIENPPTQAELPYDDGVPMESARHKAQMDLLIDALIPWLSQREDGFVGGNMFVYYSLAQLRNQDFRGPDFFVVLSVPQGERKSWVVWEEGKAPDVVIELLSESTATVDKNEKKLIYQNQMRVPEYFWYDPFNPDDWAGFSIQQRVYQPLVVSDRNQLVSESLGLALQRWQGNYKGIEATWLRWATLAGELLLTPEEQEYQRAEHERQRADRAEAQLLQTARNLLAGGMTAEQVASVTGMDVSAIAPLISTSES
ncbi:Uma2 family endonuclease [Komarekiella sp. 'clone 1']|uniref:Uma2 family endonuclease n=1 Tax=Komarekiella delphini-convector SJRDD-AB1 TaxID=2593771 RepID=A0AA40SSW3_9NOST|nr:Uma2 family endonuclease [Komarekiella delphini-convector]MBD6614666.1 Uma2 family endonuclease [Komarekiella delphini-convector SJRDD-AB1]